MISDGLANGRGHIALLDTTTLTYMFTLPHDGVRELIWLDDDSFLTRSDFNILHWSKATAPEGGNETSWICCIEIQQGEWVLGWAKRNNNEIVFAHRPREFYGGHKFHVRLLNIHDRTVMTLFTVDLSADEGYEYSFFNGRIVQMFVCDNKWLLIVPREIAQDGAGIQIAPIYVYNVNTGERVQFFVQEWRCGMARASESSRTFFLESWSENFSTPRIMTMLKLGEDGILTPVGHAFPIVGHQSEDEGSCMQAVSETHIACISEASAHNRGIFLYNAITGVHEKTIPGWNRLCVMAISNQRNELLCLQHPAFGESNEESTIGVFCLGMLPRPTY